MTDHALAAGRNCLFPPLICSTHGQQLVVRDDRLVCANGHSWRIIDGIPRMVSEFGNYADAFGLQWNTYRQTQLDSYTGTTISRDRLRRCLGEEGWAELNGSVRLQVLEAGCGAGRFTEILTSLPAAAVTSTDYSSAVEANQRNCPQNDRNRIIQADIMASPFPPASFDLVICLGVIQHTPDPEATIRSLYTCVRPGGRLVLDHYTYNIALLTKMGLLIRPVLKRLRPRTGLAVTERLVDLFLPLHKAVRGSRILQVALSRVSPVTSYYQAYPQLDEQLQREWALLDTHDGLTDYYKHLRTRSQIQKTLTDLGAVDIECYYAGNGVEARCRRPAS